MFRALLQIKCRALAGDSLEETIVKNQAIKDEESKVDWDEDDGVHLVLMASMPQAGIGQKLRQTRNTNCAPPTLNFFPVDPVADYSRSSSCLFPHGYDGRSTSLRANDTVR